MYNCEAWLIILQARRYIYLWRYLTKKSMNKKILLCVLVGIAVQRAAAQAKTPPQTGRVDTVAVDILDKMSATIGDLSSCSVTVNSNYDVVSHHLGLIKHSDQEQLYLHGPNKL